MNQQSEIYQRYVKQTTKDNVEPTVLERNVWPKTEGETWERSLGRDGKSSKWGSYEYGEVKVYVSNLGRVMEVQSLNRGLSFICAIFENERDQTFYRQPLGMFHYLYT